MSVCVVDVAIATWLVLHSVWHVLSLVEDHTTQRLHHAHGSQDTRQCGRVFFCSTTGLPKDTGDPQRKKIVGVWLRIKVTRVRSRTKIGDVIYQAGCVTKKDGAFRGGMLQHKKWVVSCK